MINLYQVTLCAIGSADYKERHQRAIDISSEKIEFGSVKNITQDIRDLTDYSRAVLYDLRMYINTDFALIVQGDGYVTAPEMWTDEFLQYDYIGAPWPPDTHFTKEGVEVRVGNGGFSLRSKKLLNALHDLKLPFTDNGTGYFHEDGIICVYYRKQLEDYGIKFAPVELAARFSTELQVPETTKSFGKHKYL